MSTFTLGFEDFDAIRRLIHTHSGIWLNDNKTTFLQVRLADRLRTRNISSVREYYHFLKYDPLGNTEELQCLMDAVTVNETWFFRETGPLEAWRDQVLPDLVKRGGRIRLWSAGCSTGEEPYTLAMLLLEACPDNTLSRIEIIATDISYRALDIARAGVYDQHSLRHTGSRWLLKYFEPASGGKRAVNEIVRRRVRFKWANLMQPNLGTQMQPLDAVLCRNVIIYFDEISRRTVLNNYYTALNPTGYLILGHSESLAHSVLMFEVAKVNGTIVYRKGK